MQNSITASLPRSGGHSCLSQFFLTAERICGIMTAKQSLYLRIPVSAFTAEIRALKSAGGCHIRRIWYNKRKNSLPYRVNRKRGCGAARPAGKAVFAGMSGDESSSDGRKDGEG